MVADVKELQEMDASELHARRLDTPKMVNFIFPIADGTDKLSGGDRFLRTSTFIRDHPDQGEEQENLPGKSDGSSPPLQDSSPDDGEARYDFWSISGNIIHRHHVEPRVKLYVSREESFPIPLKFIDVTRNTDTSLDKKH